MSKDGKHIKSKYRVGFSSIFGIGVAFVLLGLAVFAGIYMERNTFINAVEFEGTYFTEPSDLFSAIDSPIGVRADSIQFDSLFEQLKGIPYVKDVSVKMSIRGKLTFFIKEHEPIAMLTQGANRTYISEGGILLPIVPERIFNAPLVYGIDLHSFTDSTRTRSYWMAEQFLLAAKKSDIGWATISEIAWNEQEGIVALTHENGVKLIFGHDDYEQKMSHWSAFYSEVVPWKGIQSFEVIDLRFRDQIVTKNL